MALGQNDPLESYFDQVVLRIGGKLYIFINRIFQPVSDFFVPDFIPGVLKLWTSTFLMYVL